jgi:hypothetical protein
MPKATTVYGIVSFGGHLVRGMARIVLTTEEPLTVLESDKLYYGDEVKARVTKTKALTMHELTTKLDEAFASHKTSVPHIYKLNSSESVKILKTVFDVKTCKKLSFSKDSDDDSEDNESTVSAKEEEPKVKSTTAKTDEPQGKVKSTTAKTDEPQGKIKSTTTKTDEPQGKVKSTTAKTDEPQGKIKSTTAKTDEPQGKVKSTTAKTDEPQGKVKSTTAKTDEPKSNKVKVVKEEISTSSSNKKPDLTDSKKTSTSKVSSSTVRIPLSDSDDLDSDEEL